MYVNMLSTNKRAASMLTANQSGGGAGERGPLSNELLYFGHRHVQFTRINVRHENQESVEYKDNCLKMRREIAAALFFLKRLLKRNNKLESEKIDLFAERFACILQDKFKGHWYPDNPSKGQAYRCIRVNRVHRQDPDILRACKESGIQYSELGLPRELTIWVDPGEVCCRLEENKPYLTVATMSNDDEGDKEVAKKVASALERVTSDYHSGSSSDEESTRNSPLTIPNRHFDNQLSHSAQWNFRRMATGRGHIFPKPQHLSRSRNKPLPNQIFRPHAWIPSAQRKPPGYWGVSQGYNQYY